MFGQSKYSCYDPKFLHLWKNLSIMVLMNLELVDRYRKQIETSIWLLIVLLFGITNFLPLEIVVENRHILNLITCFTAGYTLIYYRVIVPRIKNVYTILFSNVVYTVVVMLFIHYSGSLQSVLFGLIFIPILISALLLGAQTMLIIVGIEIMWLTAEYLFFQDTNLLANTSIVHLFERVFAVSLVAFVTYTNSKEIYVRQHEHAELIKRQEELEKLKKQEDLIVNSVQEMVLAVDLHGHILFTNETFLTLLELTPTDVNNKSYRDIFKVFEVDQTGNFLSEVDLLLTEEYKLYFTPKNKPRSTSYKLVTNKKQYYVDIAINPLKNVSEANRGIVIVIRNVDEEHQMERMKIDFVSMAAHELRTPITAIRGYLEALKEEAWSKLTAEEQKFVQRADIASQQLATLMENLLSVSRIEKGTYKLDQREVDWVQLLHDRIEELLPRAREHNLNLTLITPDTVLPKVFADPLRIAEVVNNLVGNAINYTPAGSITVELEYDAKSETIITHIKDTGQGIPSDALVHMFERFFRVSGVLEQGSKGTGLGLYICKEIVELHHGTIWVNSEVGKGSTFSFSLPTINNSYLHNETPSVLNDSKHGPK